MLHEDTLTAKLVDILETMRSTWNIVPQNTQTFLRENQRPDLIVREHGRAPIIVEVKIDGPHAPNLSGEAQAEGHIGRQLASYEPVTTAIALRLPYRFRHIPHRELEDVLRSANDLHYVLLSGDTREEIHRFPNEGWIKGEIIDVATAIRLGAIRITKVTKAAYDLEHRVNEAATLLEAARHEPPAIAQKLENILHQEACEQTSRMAMLIVANAFVFQSALAGKSGLANVPSLRQLRTVEKKLDPDDVLKAWNNIRQVNYRPIFDVAYQLIVALATDDKLIGTILWLLRNTAQRLVDKDLEQVHELAGIVFQRLIVDRKFIKTYYTRPESVTLLAALVLPDSILANTDVEGVRDILTQYKVADFACGTGALLNGVYQQLLALYELAGGSGRNIHQDMVENNLVGCDITPNASHLTAALIASNFPDIEIGNTRIDVMAYGVRRADGQYALGSLDLIENPEETLSLGLINTQRIRGDGSQANTSRYGFRHGEIDIVIENPPFTRAGADNNTTDPEVPKTIFGDQDPDIAAQMKRALQKIKNSLGNSSAGFGSHFVDLAHRMLKDNGKSVMGFVLPLTVLTSPDWQKIRKLWAQAYHSIVVSTIADTKTENCSFSADTNMAECLIVAIKGKTKHTGRGWFVCLHRRPDSHLEALEIAKNVQRLENIRRLEDPPIGGNPIKVGDEIIGSALNCPLAGSWRTARIKDLSLVQSAYHLANGHLWLPEQVRAVEIPMTVVGTIAEVGFDSNMITGKKGAFDIENRYSDEALYPGLWHVKASAQRAIVVQPDCHGIIRADHWEQAQRVLAKNSRVHHMAKLRFNANSLATLFTQREAIGVNTLPNVKFENSCYDYVYTLWSNSTLGLLCYWMHCNKQHSGRGQIRLKALRAMPTLNICQLSETTLQNVKSIFEALKHKQMLPFNQMAEDEVRHDLDRLLLSDVLGLSEETHPDVHTGMHILRKRLCTEPSIHGGKQSKIVL